LGKQYTFKTTRDTEWLEPILDGLNGKERSRYIRMALVLLFDNKRPAVTHGVSPEVRPVTPEVSLDDTHKYASDPVSGDLYLKPIPKDEPVFEAQEVDLDSTLDNLDF
jgi:hypothetical protein